MTTSASKIESILNGEHDPSIEELEPIIAVARDQYYNGDAVSFLSDAEYDAIERLLRKMDPSNELFIGVGAEVRGEKVSLPFAMPGLDQLWPAEDGKDGDFMRWVKKHGLENEAAVLLDKMDGNSLMIVYNTKGELQSAFSRGTKTEGQDVTRHVRKMVNVPKKVSGKLVVRAEVELKDADFAIIQPIIAKRIGKEYVNPRNFVAGRMNAKDSVVDEFYQYAHVIAYEIMNVQMDKVEQLLKLEDEGFTVAGYSVAKMKDLDDGKLTKVVEDAKTRSEFALDGIVIVVNSAKKAKAINKDGNPVASQKYKIIGGSDNLATAKVVAVHWRASKTGYLKPRIQIEPIQLTGVTITYCTGFNAKFIHTNVIGPGAMISITRSGDVIPYCKEVVSPSTEPDYDAWFSQNLADQGYTEWDWLESGVDIFLTNAQDNEEVRLRNLVDMFVTLGVDGLREGTIRQLVENGFTTGETIIRATQMDLIKALGESIGSKIYKNIRAKLSVVPMATLADASRKFPRGIGTDKTQKALDAFPDMNTWNVGRLTTVDGLSEKSAEYMMEGLPGFLQFLQDINGYYKVAEPVKPAASGDLVGVNVCFTGVRDKDLEAKIMTRGGSIASGVNKNTTHLVLKDLASTSSKSQKAAELGIPMMELNEARVMWG